MEATAPDDPVARESAAVRSGLALAVLELDRSRMTMRLVPQATTFHVITSNLAAPLLESPTGSASPYRGFETVSAPVASMNLMLGGTLFL